MTTPSKRRLRRAKAGCLFLLLASMGRGSVLAAEDPSPPAAAVAAASTGTESGQAVFQAWQDALVRMDCGSARRLRDCDEVFYDGEMVGITRQEFAATFRDTVAARASVEAYLAGEVTAGNLPVGLFEYLRFSGRRPSQLAAPLARLARKQPNRQLADLLSLFVTAWRSSGFRLAMSAAGPVPLSPEHLELCRRLFAEALAQSPFRAKLAARMLRFDPLLLAEQPGEPVVKVVQGRLAQKPGRAETEDLLALLGRIWAAQPAVRPLLEQAMADNPEWLRVVLMSAIAAEMEQKKDQIDARAAALWTAGLGGSAPDGRRKAWRELPGSPRTLLFALLDVPPGESPAPELQRGLEILVFELAGTNAADVVKTRAKRLPWPAARAWADWLVGRSLSLPRHEQTRIEMLRATGMDALSLYTALAHRVDDAAQAQLVTHLGEEIRATTDAASSERKLAVLAADAGRFGERTWDSFLDQARADSRHPALWLRFVLPAIARLPSAWFVDYHYQLVALHRQAPPELRAEVVRAAERYAAARGREVLVQMALAMVRYRVEGFPVERLREAFAWFGRSPILAHGQAYRTALDMLYGPLLDRLEAAGKPRAMADIDAALHGIQLTPALRSLTDELRQRVRTFAPFQFSM